MPAIAPRLAVRAIILHDERLLLVNAFGGGQSDLMCAPGGGVEPGTSLPENLRREVYEETGLRIAVGAPCLVNEFHHPPRDFHQVDVYFRCSILGDARVDDAWRDPEDIVTERRWVTRAELTTIRVKPDSLATVAFDPDAAPYYDPLELLVR